MRVGEFRSQGGLVENDNIVILQLQLTRRKALFILAAFFLCWHPRFLGSETLTLTTYYPAPYGGYAALLTTGGTVASPVNTLLTRDAGNVGVGLGAGVPAQKFQVNASGTNAFVVTTAGNVGIGTTTPGSKLEVNGDLSVVAPYAIKVCTTVDYSVGLTVPCPAAFPMMISHWGGACTTTGMLFLGGNVETPSRWIPHIDYGCKGTMLCCRIGV